MQGKKILFLDRDGVINKDVAYLHEIAKLEWMPTLVEGLRYAQAQGYEIIVVTNQSGVARGYFPEEAVHALHQHMRDTLAAQGVSILAFYYCPHHPEGVVAAYRKDCDCRKPRPGMLEQACAAYPIDRKASVLIGDSPRDVQAAEAAHVRGVLFDESKETIAECIRRVCQEG